MCWDFAALYGEVEWLFSAFPFNSKIYLRSFGAAQPLEHSLVVDTDAGHILTVYFNYFIAILQQSAGHG